MRDQTRKLSEDHLVMLDRALSRLLAGRSFERRLTLMERRVVAIAALSPTDHLTISSVLEHHEFMRAFAALKKRHQRNRSGRPLVYVGTTAKGHGNGGTHAHLLLWDSMPYRWLHGHATAVGFGHVKVVQLPTHSPGDISTPETWVQTAYVLGQHEALFNSDTHFKHRDRLKSKHGFISTALGSLRKHKPELSAALEIAKDPTVTDEEIAPVLHKFIRSI